MNARNRGREVAQEQALNPTCGQQTQTRVPRRGCEVKPLTSKPDNLSSGSQAHRKTRWQEVGYNTCEIKKIEGRDRRILRSSGDS